MKCRKACGKECRKGRRERRKNGRRNERRTRRTPPLRFLPAPPSPPVTGRTFLDRME